MRGTAAERIGGRRRPAAGIDAVLQRGLAKDPNERPATAIELVEGIEAALTSRSRPSRRGRCRSSSRRRPPCAIRHRRRRRACACAPPPPPAAAGRRSRGRSRGRGSRAGAAAPAGSRAGSGSARACARHATRRAARRSPAAAGRRSRSSSRCSSCRDDRARARTGRRRRQERRSDRRQGPDLDERERVERPAERAGPGRAGARAGPAGRRVRRERGSRGAQPPGLLADRAGDYAAAVEPLQSAVEGYRDAGRTGELDYAYALYNYGVALNRSGNPEAAVDVLRERLEINNQRGTVRKELDDALAKPGEGGKKAKGEKDDE